MNRGGLEMDLGELLILIYISPMLLAFGLMALCIGIMAAIFVAEAVFIVVAAVIIAAKTILGPVVTPILRFAMPNLGTKREKQSFNPVLIVIHTNKELEKSFAKMERELKRLEHRLNRKK